MKKTTPTSRPTIHLGDLFKSRKEPGRPGLPTNSVTMNDGLVMRDTLERKNNGTLAPEDHLLIRTGDIAYNMMRMWQGASGLAEHEGIVSPAYVVVAPKDDIDPLYASYWFKSERMVYLFWAYSYGITGDRLRLYYKDFARIPVTIPPKPKQKRIARTLATMDRAIQLTADLIAAKRELKRGLAQQLLTGERRLPGFTESWRTKQIGDLVSCHFSGVDKKTQGHENPVRLCNYTDVYYNDRITDELNFMEATASEIEITNLSLRQGDVIITKDSETPDDIAKPAVVMQDMPDVICGYHLAILRPKNVDGYFIAQLLRLPRTRYEFFRVANGVTRFGLTQPALRQVQLLIPDHDEQERIAAVLGAADRKIALLEDKLAALRDLKKGLMQRLLAGGVRHPQKGSSS